MLVLGVATELCTVRADKAAEGALCELRGYHTLMAVVRHVPEILYQGVPVDARDGPGIGGRGVGVGGAIALCELLEMRDCVRVAEGQASEGAECRTAHLVLVLPLDEDVGALLRRHDGGSTGCLVTYARSGLTSCAPMNICTYFCDGRCDRQGEAFVQTEARSTSEEFAKGGRWPDLHVPGNRFVRVGCARESCLRD